MIRRAFWVQVTHPKGVVFWISVDYNIIEEKEENRYIVLNGFIINYFIKRSMGGLGGYKWVSIFEAYN